MSPTAGRLPTHERAVSPPPPPRVACRRCVSWRALRIRRKAARRSPAAPASYLHVPREVDDVMLRLPRCGGRKGQVQQHVIGFEGLGARHLRQPQQPRPRRRGRGLEEGAPSAPSFVRARPAAARGPRQVGSRSSTEAHGPCQAEKNGAEKSPHDRGYRWTTPAHGGSNVLAPRDQPGLQGLPNKRANQSTAPACPHLRGGVGTSAHAPMGGERRRFPWRRDEKEP